MPILRLAYATQFLLAIMAVFLLWSEVGGQSHLDLMPWYVKLGLGGGAAFAVVKATAASVGGQPAWNGRVLKWLGILLVLLICCGLSSYYVHMNLEEDEDEQDQGQVTSMVVRRDVRGTVRRDVRGHVRRDAEMRTGHVRG